MAQQANPPRELSSLRLIDVVGEWLGERDPHFAPNHWHTGAGVDDGKPFSQIICGCLSLTYNMGLIYEDHVVTWNNPLNVARDGLTFYPEDPEFFEKFYQAMKKWHEMINAC